MPKVSPVSEIRRTLALAFPIIIGHLCQMLMGITDSVMIGQVGKVPLAGSAFVNSLFTIPFIVGIGVLLSVSVLVAREHGANQPRDCSQYLRHGMLLALVVGVLGAGLMMLTGLGLDHFGQPPEVVAVIEPYFQLIAISLVPTLFFQVLRQYSEAVNHPWGPMGILLAGVGLNVLLNWILIYGHWGAPALGLEGAGWATLAARILTVMGLWLWLENRSEVRKEWPGRNDNVRWLGEISWLHVRALLRIGIPAAGMLLFEAGAFSLAALMMGWIGTVALAAHQIAISCAACVYMIPLGLSIATSVRIGRAVGEKRLDLLRPIGFGSLAAGVAFALGFTLLFALVGPWIVAGFTRDVEVIRLSARLLIVAAVFQIFDGGQAISSGALRGLQDVRVPTVITFVAYWLIAMPVGYFLGVRGIGPMGVWSGLAVGLGVASTFLAWRFHAKTSPQNLSLFSG